MSWSPADLRTVGYFAKKLTRRPDWLQAPQVEFVCSVTACECAAQSLPGWIDRWLHNTALFLFDSLSALEQVIPAAEADDYVRYGVRTLPVMFEDDREVVFDLTQVHPEPIPPGFVRLGCEMCTHIGSTFDSSAMSCGHLAARYPTNCYCLVDDFDSALRLAVEFGRSKPEPGAYALLELWADSIPGARCAGVSQE